jgi:ATP-dependent Clp endopeptidase proteolytic subunit ClpP
MSARLFNVRNAAAASGPATIEVYEEIGKDWWTQEGMGAKEFAAALKEVPADQDIIVAINSPGGNVWDGLAIYHQLQARKDRVTCRVDGIAASIASVIAMAGTITEMPENALMMIHNPWSIAMGDADAMRKAADELDKHRDVLVGIYHDKTGMARSELERMMSEETWMTGKEAADYGFADGTTDALSIAASVRHPAAFQFRNAPKQAATAACQPQTNQGPQMEPTAPTAAPVANPAPAPAIDHAALAASIAALLKPEPSSKPTEPIAPSASDMGNPAYEAYCRMEPGAKRAEFRRQHENHIVTARLLSPKMQASLAALSQFRFSPQAANTIASELVNDVLIDSFTAVAVHNRLAPLDACLKMFDTVPMKPLTPVDIRKATAAATGQLNPTDFESGDGTLSYINVVPNQYTQAFQMRNDDLQKGSRLGHLAEINANAFADTLHTATTTLMTAANFGSTTIVVGAATAWTSASLQAILAPVLAAGKNYDQRVLMLDGSHLAYLMPLDRNSFAFGEQGGWGFDRIIPNSRWTNAQTNCCGFLSNGKAIVAVAGLPYDIAPGMFESNSTAQTKNGLTVAVKTWYSLKTRTIWASYDSVFGTAVLDGTAGRVLITA